MPSSKVIQENLLFERPRKKAKAASAMDAVSDITRVGTANFNLGKYELAEICFFQALRRIRFQFRYEQMSAVCLKKISKLTSMETSVERRKTSCTESNLPFGSTRATQISLRHEYDEGTYVYFEPIVRLFGRTKDAEFSKWKCAKNKK